MYGWENAGLMSPWATAWGMQPQTIADTVIRDEVAPAMRMSQGGEGKGFSVGGDPSKASQTSQATKDRVRDSLTGSIGRAVGRGALNATIGSLMGMPSDMIGSALASGIASPSSIGGVLGGALNAALGTQPTGFMGKAIGNFAVPAMAGLAFGPVGGLVGGLMGGVVSDAVMDGLDMRSREGIRDDYEGEGLSNQARGRQAYADRVGLEQAASRVRDSLPNSAAAMHAMDQAIAATRALERSYGINPSYGLDPGRSSLSYGGWGNVGGPLGGARAVDSSYGRNMGGFAGLGIGNPSSYGGRDSGRDNNVGGARGSSTGTGGGYNDGRGGVTGL